MSPWPSASPLLQAAPCLPRQRVSCSIRSHRIFSSAAPRRSFSLRPKTAPFPRGPQSNGNFPTNALLAHDDSASGAVYQGLAILTPQCCREYLALTNLHNGFVATYDIGFNLLATTGSFKDSNL